MSSDRTNYIPVYVNIYNLNWLNKYLGPIGLGLYHSGIEVDGKEYAYGGHHYNFSGIYEMVPRRPELLGDQCTFNTSICLGHVDITKDDMRYILKELGNQFTGQNYHLTQNNCNHFSNYLAEFLCNRSIPNWVNRMAYITNLIPVPNCVPTNWLRPPSDPDVN